MNGNKLYRSMSEAKIGGVAAGLGNYFKVDPTIFRLIFVLGAIFTGGALVLVYLALWLFMPTAASTSSDLGGVVRENLDEMGSKLRGVTNGGNAGSASTPTNQASSAQTNGSPGGASTTPVGDHAQPQTAQAGVARHHHMGILPLVLIGLGIFFLMGSFRMHWGGAHWYFPWPLLLIGLGILALKGRRYR
ncbi:MAG TPA: PspC domain-containing protein [Chloroflexia bacterium]|nr:PspC domain-containing protein [Chloroflexia bacterium]